MLYEVITLMGDASGARHLAEFGVVFLMFRITSYNVCYTKLLRLLD